MKKRKLEEKDEDRVDRLIRISSERIKKLGLGRVDRGNEYGSYFRDFDDFEDFSKSILREIVFTDMDAEFYRKKAYASGRTGNRIMVDISIEFKIGDLEYITIVECKYQKRSIEVSKVRELIQKKDEIGAHKAVLISNADFQSGAVALAGSAGIALLRVCVAHDRRFALYDIESDLLGPPPYWGIINNQSDLKIPSPEKSIFGDTLPGISCLVEAISRDAKQSAFPFGSDRR